MCHFIRRLALLGVIVLAFGLLMPTQAIAQEESPFSAEELAYIQNADTLKIGYVQDRIPVSFRDENGELAGISRYIFDRISKLSGLSFQYVPLPGGAVTYDYLMGEGFDLVTSVEYNKENLEANGILISQPYLSSNKVIVSRADFSFSYSAQQTVAVSSGSQTVRKVLREAFPNFTLKDYDTIGDCFSAVDSGDADMMLLNQYVVEYWLYKPAYENLKVIPALGFDDQLCFSAVIPFGEKENADARKEGQLLISILNKSIEMLEEDEVDSYTIQAIMENRYQFTIGDFLYRYRYALIVLAAAAMLILLLAVLLFRQRLQAAEERADARARDRFLSSMSHEIRTPLNGLIGLNYLMSRRAEDKQQLSRYLNQSTLTAQYLLSLVNDMLDMSMLRKGKVTLEKKPVDLDLLVSTAASIVERRMEEHRLAFSIQGSFSYPVVVGDGFRIQQILLNLLDNAEKFTPEGGKVTLSLRQELTEENAVRTWMEVADTGKGMSEAFQGKIFDSFAQEQDTVSKGDQGVGLGLPISYRLAKLMGGELTFSSKAGEGSVFTFSFEAAAADRKQKQESDPTENTWKNKRILVAEDNELNAEIMLDLLEECGCRADHAPNGQRALELFEASAEGYYNVILMDLLMPVLNGYEAARAIRTLKRSDAASVRIIACSANCTEQDREKAFHSGMDDFIEKPIEMEELLQKIGG